MDENITNNEATNFQTQTHDSQQMPNIDELQALIMKQMAADEEENKDYFDEFESDENLSLMQNETEGKLSSDEDLYDISPSEKKYVVSINPDLVPFFDELPPEKRTELVNSLVVKHLENQKTEPNENRIKKLISHLSVILLTTAIGLPLIFHITNASIQATVNSYREVQNNFEKLYQQKGGVKRKNMNKMQNLQY